MAVTLTNEMIQGAKEAQERYGVPASVTLGQIMLESGGSYAGGLSKLAYNDNNLFGIKAGSSWKGATVLYPTKEYVNGSYITVNAKFRKYDSIADSIDDHGKLLASSIYTSKTANAKTLEEYVKAMGSVYATAPNYADLLLNTIKTNNLDKYDNGDYSVGDNYGDNVNNSTSGGFLNWKGILSGIVKFVAIVLLAFLAVVFFATAFKDDIVKATMKKVGDSLE